ncbi:MAG: hypothetical protein D6753_17985 [Planctomycetota bacterium]|nr:MAG: hypothetical protein D6753_17985 [Planctomycetota bacterium]
MLSHDPGNPTKGGTESAESYYMHPRQERLATWTHGLGVVLGVGLSVYFWSGSWQPFDLQVAVRVFAAAVILLYFCSAASHAVWEPRSRNWWRAADQAAIYVLIVATYTPFVCLAFEGPTQTVFLAVLWGLAAAGAVSKLWLKHRINAISTVSYLMLGWLPALGLIPYSSWLSCVGMAIGGLLYTAGIPFLMLSSRHWHAHTIWHLMVLAGTSAHAATIVLVLRAQTG